MKTPKALSILIPTLETRKQYLARLLERLNPQLTDQIELLIDCDNGEAAIGQKRQRLLERSTGSSIVFCDDDDLVSDHYCTAILTALKGNPDCVGFNIRVLQNGKFEYWTRRSITIDPTLAVDQLGPNHLTPVRRSIAIQIGFLARNHCEDAIYMRGIRPLLKSEVFIDDFLYTVLWRADRTGEITNLIRSQT